MVQPMFAKMVLPRFGGAPSMWSVAIVFFQTALLAGYAYAHWLTRYAGGRASVAIHLAVTIAAAFALPLSIAAGWGRPPQRRLSVARLFNANGIKIADLHCPSPIPHRPLFRREVLAQPFPLQCNWQCAMRDGQ